MEGLRPDHWHTIAKYLSVIDLCHMMQLSHSSFYLWVADRAWAHQRQRICARFPALNAIFDLYCEQGASGQHTSKRAEKSNANKKRKTAWITPRKGIWYVFKRWLILGTTMKGIKSLCKREEMHPIVISVIQSTLPYQEYITSGILIEQNNRPKNAGSLMYSVKINWGDGDNYYFYAELRHRRDSFDLEFFYNHTSGDGERLDEFAITSCVYNPYKIWKKFLFGKETNPQRMWTDRFKSQLEWLNYINLC